MKYYTQTISYELAEKLKAKGMPCRIDNATNRTDATYASCFDWLMEKGLSWEVLVGDAAEELWNSMIYQVISKVGGYNQKSVNKNFDYDVKRNKMMEVLKKYNIDNLILN